LYIWTLGFSQISYSPADGVTRFALLVGDHRVESAKLLGWTHIDAFITECVDVEADIWVIDENLKRAELTVLERAQLHKKRVELSKKSAI
jgi:ParB-like chromosome segregation protein Spo0J